MTSNYMNVERFKMIDDYEEDYTDYLQRMDCRDGYHAEPVSGCCGAGEHEYVEGMCGACNEFTGWDCSVCEKDISDLVY